MKKALILLSSALFMVAIAAAPGCSGGDDDDDAADDDDGALASGSYAVSNAALTNTCAAGGTSYYAGVTEADVTATATDIAITGFPDDIGYDISGTNLVDNLFGTPTTTDLDYSDNTSADYPLSPSTNEYNCKATFTVEYAGTITGSNAFSLEDSVAIASSGAGCSVAVVSSAFSAPLLAVPCSSSDTVDLAL